MRPYSAVVCLLLAACAAPDDPASSPSDSARSAFARTVDSLLLDTNLHELRGMIMVKVPNSVVGDESPLQDQPYPHPATPGPHTLDGILYSEIGALRRLLGDRLPVRVEREMVFVGPAGRQVLIMGHYHDDVYYVPVKLFARQYGAYVDITCPMANCGIIWPRAVMEHMHHMGAVGGTGMLGAHAEGLFDGIDVTRLPTG